MDANYTKLAIWSIVGRILLGLGILALIGFIFITTKNIKCLWGLFGLIAISIIPTYSSKPAHIPTQCPHCQHEFIAIAKSDDDDDDEDEEDDDEKRR